MKGRQVAELQGRVNNARLSSVAPLLGADIVFAQSKESTMAQHISYRTVKVDGISFFYREAGPKDAPTILRLHGLPSSSRMFEPLLTRLARQFHAVSMADQCFSFSSMGGRSEERQRDGIHRNRGVGADVIKK
jgi:hypothetical protein